MMDPRENQESDDDDFEVLMFIEEPFDPNKKPMYCKNKVYDNGVEYSLEEIRARRYMPVSSNNLNIVNNMKSVAEQSKAIQNQNIADDNHAMVACKTGSNEYTLNGKRKKPILTDALMDKENIPSIGGHTILDSQAKSVALNNVQLNRTYSKIGEKDDQGSASTLDDIFLKQPSNPELDVTSYTRAFTQPLPSSTPFHGVQKPAGSLHRSEEGRNPAALKKRDCDNMSGVCTPAARALKELSTIEECNSGSLGASSGVISTAIMEDNVLNSGTKNGSRMPSLLGGHTDMVKPPMSRIPYSINRMKSTKVSANHGNDSVADLRSGSMSMEQKEFVANEDVEIKGGGECMAMDRMCKQFEEMAIAPDPFDSNLLDELLKKLKISVSQRIGYYSVAENIPLVKGNCDLHLRKGARDGGHLLKTLKMIGQGAYAKVYKAHSTKWNKTIALKIQKPPCPWEFYISNEIHERVTDINMKSSFMNVKEACIYTDASVLLSDFKENGTLLDVINIFKMKRMKIPEVLATYFTLDVLRIVHCLHSCKIIHADIKPDNFLIKKLPVLNEYTSVFGETSLQLIDLGRCIDLTLFPPDSCFNVVFQRTYFQCIEMRTKKPWTYQVDLFHIASLVHVLVFGEYMDVVHRNGIWSVSKKVSRNLNQDLWNWFFNIMLNIESCNMLPNLAEVIKKVENVYKKSMVQHLLPAMSTLRKFISEEKLKK